MRVALVTSWATRCGIASHSEMMKQYVEAADPTIRFWIDPAWLDPNVALPQWETDRADLTVLNYHRGLHSRWTPERVATIHGPKIVVMHDTYETQPDRLPWDLLDACDAMIVHEPCDLYTPAGTVVGQQQPHASKVHYWRQGVPEPDGTTGYPLKHGAERPYVGTCGFAFPWKGFELLCDAAALVGWGVRICSHNATDAQVLDWETRNPRVDVRREYARTGLLIANLAQCDATAFLYSCANSGTSGAIRLGIAAGKPVLATKSCRQFRDIEEEDAIDWVPPNVLAVGQRLRNLPLQRFSSEIVQLREQDSWRHLGKKYAALYSSLVHA